MVKNWFKKNCILLILVLLGTAAALTCVLHRSTVEQENMQYDIVLDYNSIEEMSEKSQEDMDFWLAHFRTLGLNKLAIYEDSISSLLESYPGILHAETPANILSQFNWQSNYPEAVQKVLLESAGTDDILLSCEDSALFVWIREAFQTRSDVPLWNFEDEAGTGFLFLSSEEQEVTGARLCSLPLGLDPKKKAQALEHGYTIVLRTASVEGLNGETFAQAVYEDYKELGVPYFIGGGNGIPGYESTDHGVALLSDYLDSADATLGLIENSSQSKNWMVDGMDSALEETNNNAVRVFSMWDYVQWRYGWYNYDGPQEITNCLYRAAYERNCRLIYLKAMMQEDSSHAGTYHYVTDPDAYERLLSDFTGRMDARGFTMETLHAAEPVSVSFPLLLLIAIGAVAAAVTLLRLFFPLSAKVCYALTILGIIAAAGTLYVLPNTGRLILSIAGGAVMPLLAVIALTRLLDMQEERSLLPTSIAAVLGVALISLVGGLFAAAPLSDTSYMLEINLYRGVKVMQLVPLAGFICYLLLVFLRKPYFRNIRSLAQQERHLAMQKLLDTNIKVRHILWTLGAGIVLGALMLVGSYYLARTGHSGNVDVSNLELELRNLMEQYLIARPRTKEFLVGYPCVMLYVWSRRKPQKFMKLFQFIVGLGAVIGATSIVNTFLHIRTGFLLSLIRVLTGFVSGLVIGLVAVAPCQLIYRIITKRMKHV